MRHCISILLSRLNFLTFSDINILQMLLRVVFISDQSFQILITLVVSVCLFQKS